MATFKFQTKDLFKKVEGSTSALERLGLITSHQAGFIHHSSLALTYVKKLEELISDILSPLGWTRITSPTLISGKAWEVSGRWEQWSKDQVYLSDEGNMLLAPTSEEVFFELYRKHWLPYLDLNGVISTYQIGEKFRREKRVRLATRTRQFTMFDGYSMSKSYDVEYRFFFLTYRAMLAVFNHLGVKLHVARSEDKSMGNASSYEFWCTHPLGETSYRLTHVVNRGGILYDSQDHGEAGRECRGLELGHIFFFNDHYSKVYGLPKNVKFSSYGMGVTRCLELAARDNTLRWPTGAIRLAIVASSRSLIEVDKLLSLLGQRGTNVVLAEYRNVNKNFSIAAKYFSNVDKLVISGRYLYITKTGKELVYSTLEALLVALR